MTQDIFVKVLE